MIWTEGYQLNMFGAIVQVRVVFRKTVVGDWRFDYLSGSHLQSQVKTCRQMMVFACMPWVGVWSGQFCGDVIGRQNVKVVVIGWLSCCYFLSVYCLLRYVGFIWGHVWVICKVQAQCSCWHRFRQSKRHSPTAVFLKTTLTQTTLNK